MSVLVQQNVADLNMLHMHAMALAYEEQRGNAAMQDLGFDERFNFIIQRQREDKDKRKFDRLNSLAKFKVDACPENIKYQPSRGLDKAVVSNLLTCDWIKKTLNLVITGPTGAGKTWLGCAFGQQAVRKGYSVLYKRLSRLLEELVIAYADGSLHKVRAKLAKVDLLILDDWGLAPITTLSRQELLELVDDRTGSGSILITSQLPVEQWHDYLGEPTVADAILDRIVQRAHRIELRGESLRKADVPMSVTKGME